MIFTRHVHLKASASTYRMATFEGADRIVVPIVALVEGVIFAMGAENPELVLAEEFSLAPGGWNGRPVMNDHPMIDGVPVSANVPSVLEAAAYGQIFNAKVVGKKLTMEEWIDPIKAASIGGEAQQTVDDLLAGKMTEISVGLTVRVEAATGIHQGKSYSGIWREIVPDHIANLPRGTVGACSNAMGCGTLRAARITDDGFEQETPMAEPTTRRTLRERIQDLFRASVKGWNQSEIRDALRTALKQIEPLYDYIDDVWEEDGYVVYCVYSPIPGGMLSFHPDGYPMDPYTMKIYRRDFSMTAEGVVTFKDRAEVEFVGGFELVKAAARAACACGGQASPTAEAAAGSPEGDDSMKTKIERVTALMANEHNTLKNEAVLTAASDEVLTALEAHCESAAALKAASATATAQADEATRAAAAQPAALTTEQFMAAAPAEVKDIVTRFKAAEAAKKVELVTKLKAAQKAHSEEELNAMTVDQLLKIATLIKVDAEPIDYSGRFAGGAPDAQASEQPNYAPPDAYKADLDARRTASAGRAQ